MRNILFLVVTSVALLYTTASTAESRYITDKISIAVYPQNDKKSEPIKTLPPAEIAQVIAFFCSNKASFTTGATIDVNGGVLMV